MTNVEARFLAALAPIAPQFTWTLDGGILRGQDPTGELYCPLTALAKATGKGDYHPGHWCAAANAMGYTLPEIGGVISAADDDGMHDHTLQHALYNAVGIACPKEH